MKKSILPIYAALWILLASACASQSLAAEDEYESGDSWTYDITMTMDSMFLSGTYTESYERDSTRSIAGYAYSTYEFTYQGTMSVTGTLWDYPVSGLATMTGVDSIKRDSLSVVVSDYRLSMTLSVDVGYPESIEYSEHNVSTYSPPDGVGDEPKNPDEGTSWTKTYTCYWETTIDWDGDISEESGSYTFTETYTYLGMQTITVPAGTFECEVTQTDDSDGIWTDWYNHDAGSYVKSSYESGSSYAGTELLKSFSYTPPPSDGLSGTMLSLIVASVVVVAIVAVAVAWLFVKRKSPPAVQQVPVIVQDSGPPRPPAG